MGHKNDYSVVAFFGKESKPKSRSYIHKLQGFVFFLNDKFPNWEYINVYERRTRKYLKRFYKGNSIPDFLILFFLTFNIIEVCSTFNYGFNNPATIQILLCS